MTKNEMLFNVFATEAMQMKGFLAMHTIVHSPLYQTASCSHWERSLPTFRELIDYKFEFGMLLRDVHPVTHHNPHLDFHIISFLFLPFLVRVFSMHIMCMLCLCQIGTHEVNPFNSTVNVHSHAILCPLTILKHDVKCIAFKRM